LHIYLSLASRSWNSVGMIEYDIYKDSLVIMQRLITKLLGDFADYKREAETDTVVHGAMH
jgi:hypothetical protein